jgi:hypothetical protein
MMSCVILPPSLPPLEYFVFGIVWTEIGEEVVLDLEPLGRRLRPDHLQDHLPAVGAHLEKGTLETFLVFGSEKNELT